MLQWFTTTTGILVTIAAALTALGTIVTAILSFNKRVVRPAREKIDEAMSAVRAVPQLVLDVADIKHEVKENGGGSIKDAAGRIEGIMRARIEASDDIAVYTDAAGEIATVTAGYTKLTGLDASSARREKWKLALHPDDVESVTKAWHESLRTGTTFFAEIRFRNISVPGSAVVPCRVVTSPVLVGNPPKIVAWAANIQPIADRPAARPDPEADRALDEIFNRPKDH